MKDIEYLPADMPDRERRFRVGLVIGDEPQGQADSRTRLSPIELKAATAPLPTLPGTRVPGVTGAKIDYASLREGIDQIRRKAGSTY
ncbi:MAG: hypothetical protein WAW63_03825 [Candidatus Saccharimonadales bacterium]|nr:hypothetical protein [Candidatus Saccharibacteria bacterium]